MMDEISPELLYRPVPVVPKTRERLSRVNNMAKQIASESYLVTEEGLIIPMKGTFSKGFHYGIIDDLTVRETVQDLLHLQPGVAALMNTVAYFETQRDFKTKIKETVVAQDGELALSDEEEWVVPVGMITLLDTLPTSNRTDIEDTLKKITHYETEVKPNAVYVDIDDEQQEMLKKGFPVHVQHGRYRSQIIKTLCPNFNASSLIRVHFAPHPVNERWFLMLISVERDGVTNTHIYTVALY